MSRSGRRWFEQPKGFTPKPRANQGDVPEVWTRCPGCHEALYNETLAEHLLVCAHCGHHLPMAAHDRLASLCDQGSLVLHDEHLASVDVLEFTDTKPYTERLARARQAADVSEAYRAATGTIHGVEVEIGSFDFRFLGGSMGSVVGERVTRQVERAIDARRPVVIVSASGGARMQEGMLSLMQMAKTSGALAALKDQTGMPYLSVLAHPTTGGVAASFAMQGDLIFAEPGALIGFAGPRVIRETIGEQPPEGFQRAEHLLQCGMIDRVVPRQELRGLLGRVLRQLLGLPAREGHLETRSKEAT